MQLTGLRRNISSGPSELILIFPEKQKPDDSKIKLKDQIEIFNLDSFFYVISFFLKCFFGINLKHFFIFDILVLAIYWKCEYLKIRFF